MKPKLKPKQKSEPAVGPIYIRIADEIAASMDSGQLQPGDRLPSVRRLVQQKGVSATTAVAALRELENRGLVVARPQSGYFAHPKRSIAALSTLTRPSSAPHAVGIDSVIVRMVEASHDASVAPLGMAVPDPQLFPNQRLQRVLSATARRHPVIMGQYSPHYHGVQSLQHQILRRYAEIGCKIDPDEMLVVNGCMEALNLALRAVTKPGDCVALESPVYYGILQILQDMGLKALEISTHPADGIDLDALEKALAVKGERAVKACIVSANFSNPTGALMSDDNKRRLVQLCESHKVPLIEDDVYGDLQHVGQRPLPAKAFDTSGNVILCSSFSKALAPGIGVGWMCGGRYSPDLRRKKFSASSAVPAVLQEALAEIMRSGGYERHLIQLRSAFKRQVAQFSSAVAQHFPAGTQMTQPSGSYLIWVELPRGIDSLELYDRAIKHRVNFAPGPLFSATGRYRQSLRLNCGYRWTPALDAAVARLGALASDI